MSLSIFGFICVHLVLFGNSSRKRYIFERSEESVETTTREPIDPMIAIEKKLNWNVWCKYQPNSYDCEGRGSNHARFYYDIQMDDCKASRFGGCKYNNNRFSSMKECHDHCRDPGPQKISSNLSERVYCRFQHDFGTCNEYFPMWYYDISLRVCKGFSYSGCGGNFNRFPTAQICTATCAGVIEYK